MSDNRFSVYGKLAPSSKADMAFVQHMVYQLPEHGTMAVLLPHGVLFRSGSEGHIRQYLIEEMNCLDAVIGLPANIFYGNSILTWFWYSKNANVISTIFYLLMRASILIKPKLRTGCLLHLFC